MKIRHLLWFVVIVLLVTGSALNLIIHFKKSKPDHGRSSTDGFVRLKSSGDCGVDRGLSADIVFLSPDSGYSYSDDACLVPVSIDEISPDISRPVSMDMLTSQPETRVPAIAIVIDDFGYSLSQARDIADIPMPLTWSIIPDIPYSMEIMDMATEKNIPFLIHVPMQALIDEVGGPYLIGEDMDYYAVRSEIHRITELFPNAVGINNHRGSKATSNSDIMTAVMDEIAEANLIFLDSRTSRNSVAYTIARDKDIPALYNSVFLDHEDTIDFMVEQFQKAREIARRRGWVVAICHVRPGTINFLSTLCIKDDIGVEFFTVPGLLKMLLEYKEVSYLERKS